MKRLFLAFLLLGLAVLLIPGLRIRAEPRIEESRVWLGRHLEGPMTPVLTPYRTVRTQSRLSQVTTVLVRDRNRGREIPRPDGLGEYLSRYDIEATDAWGVPFIMRLEPDSLAVVSPGPDLEYETEDDIVAKIRYKTRGSSPFRRQ